MRSRSPANPGSIRRLAAPAVVVDGAIALGALGLTLVVLAAHPSAHRSLDVLGGALAVVACLPLVARRRRPLGTFALTTAASATLNALGYALGPPIGPTVALFFVAADPRTQARIRETAGVVAGLVAVHVGSAAIPGGGFPTTPILGATLVWGGAWLVGDQVRQRRQRIADLEERAARAERDAARDRRLAAAEERTRIARDLHDSAAHAINVILVQAGAARLLGERDPPAARAALVTIEDVARETIDDIDRLIRGLREGEPAGGRDGGAVDGDGDRSTGGVEPPTGLAGIETLAARHRATGLRVAISLDGAGRPLAPGVDQAAYRIVQESLTNAARHGSGPAEVAIGYGETELCLRVTNPIAGRPGGDGPSDGHGLLGMRERAALLGGTLDARPVGRDFRVVAHLPYAPARTDRPVGRRRPGRAPAEPAGGGDRK